MSKEEYANEIKRLAYHYNKGKEDERKRILKLIDERIQDYTNHPTAEIDEAIGALEELKKEFNNEVKCNHVVDFYSFCPDEGSLYQCLKCDEIITLDELVREKYRVEHACQYYREKEK